MVGSAIAVTVSYGAREQMEFFFLDQACRPVLLIYLFRHTVTGCKPQWCIAQLDRYI